MSCYFYGTSAIPMLLKGIQKEQKLVLLFSFVVIILLVLYIVLYNTSLSYILLEFYSKVPRRTAIWNLISSNTSFSVVFFVLW